MNPHVSDKLFNELTAAEVAHRITGISVSEFLRRRANKHNGEVKKHLLRVAALGPDADKWMTYFIEGLEESNEEVS